MQKLFLLLSTIFFVQFNSFAQDDQEDYYLKNGYHTFKIGSTQRLLADRVNVRASASTKGEIVANIPIGSKVKILEESSKTLKLNGFDAPWYEVSFETNGKEQKGYVWGGLIAEGYKKSENNDGVTFYYGIASVKSKSEGEYSYEEIQIQLRAAKAGKEIDKIEFEAIGSLTTSHNMSNKGSRGLKNVEAILNLSFSDQMCAGADGDVVVFWNDQKLHYVQALHSGSDIPVFASEKFIYPKDKGGKKDRVIFAEEAGEYGENADDVTYNYQRKTEYIWTGTKLKKSK